MAWIRTISPEAADSRLGRLYRDASAPGGQVDKIMQIHSLAPATLRGHMALYRAAMHPASGRLSGREREIVGVCVSLDNGCGYCIEHHSAGLARHVNAEVADALLVALESGADTRPLTERERAMVDYARKLTRAPGEMREADLQPLRDAGLDDAEILELNQVAAYFAYANRTVLGLGVEIEDEEIGQPPAKGEE